MYVALNTLRQTPFEKCQLQETQCTIDRNSNEGADEHIRVNLTYLNSIKSYTLILQLYKSKSNENGDFYKRRTVKEDVNSAPLFLMTFRDAAFGELPASMDTESSNGKEGMVTMLDIIIHDF